jgi:hypothetical protein
LNQKILKKNYSPKVKKHLQDELIEKESRVVSLPLMDVSLNSSDNWMINSDHKGSAEKNNSSDDSNNKGFFILIRKASEYKSYKNLQYKKEMSKIASGPFCKKFNNLVRIVNKLSDGAKPLPSRSCSQADTKFLLTTYDKDQKWVETHSKKSWIIKNNNVASSPGHAAPSQQVVTKIYSHQITKTSNHIIDLYTQFKTPLLNKQKKASQIISKYPSCDFKIISNKSLYPSLIMFKNKFLNSFQGLSKSPKSLSSKLLPVRSVEQKTVQTSEGSLIMTSPSKRKENKSLLLQEKLALNINKLNSWGLPFSTITAIGSINLSPFIISHKSPYSIDFSFKKPLHLFSDQYLSPQTKKNVSTCMVGTNHEGANVKNKSDLIGNFDSLKKVNNRYFSKTSDPLCSGASSTMQVQSDLLYFKKILNNFRLKINKLNSSNEKCINTQKFYHTSSMVSNLNEINNIRKVKSVLSSIFYCPIAEYSLGKNLDKSILYPNNIKITYPIQNTNLFLSNKNYIYNKKILSKKYKQELGQGQGHKQDFFSNSLQKSSREKMVTLPVLGSLNSFLDFSPKYKINNEVFLYKTEFESFAYDKISPLIPFINTYNYCSFEGELIFKSLKNFIATPISSNANKVGDKTGLVTPDLLTDNKNKKRWTINSSKQILNDNKKKMDYQQPSKKYNTNIDVAAHVLKNREILDQKNLENALFADKRLIDSCIILTKNDQRAFYLDMTFKTPKTKSPFIQENKLITSSKIGLNYKQIYLSLENFKKKNQYLINDTIIKFLNIVESTESPQTSEQPSDFSNTFTDSFYKLNKLPIGTSQQKNKLLLGEFLVYGDQISSILSVTKSGQIIHINNNKITIRNGQPIFVSPKAILHKYDTDFIEEQSPVITLSYQQLKTGDIIQGIPKVEQFFEARTTKRGRLFRDSLANLLKGLFKRYCSKGQPLDQAVRQSFYKIQQIIVDGVQRVYRSQGVSIADKHLEVIVKQMTSKVRILEGGQTGFFPGEIVDLNFVEQVNTLLMRKITYEPLVLGITRASLEVDSFLSAASFQQTTRVLSNAAISRKKDFLKGLKENVILGNLIPAGTGYLVYLGGRKY